MICSAANLRSNIADSAKLPQEYSLTRNKLRSNLDERTGGNMAGARFAQQNSFSYVPRFELVVLIPPRSEVDPADARSVHVRNTHIFCSYSLDNNIIVKMVVRESRIDYLLTQCIYCKAGYCKVEYLANRHTPRGTPKPESDLIIRFLSSISCMSCWHVIIIINSGRFSGCCKQKEFATLSCCDQVAIGMLRCRASLLGPRVWSLEHMQSLRVVTATSRLCLRESAVGWRCC